MLVCTQDYSILHYSISWHHFFVIQTLPMFSKSLEFKRFLHDIRSTEYSWLDRGPAWTLRIATTTIARFYQIRPKVFILGLCPTINHPLWQPRWEIFGTKFVCWLVKNREHSQWNDINSKFPLAQGLWANPHSTLQVWQQDNPPLPPTHTHTHNTNA